MRSQSTEIESSYDWRRDGWLAACALTAIVLIVAAATTHSPGFDTFLRLFVFGMALVRGFAGFRRGGAWLPLSAGLIAILFNPVTPVVRSAPASSWLDLIGAAWFALVAAWPLLKRWEPQRGWAAAALSLCALAVPAVAAFSAPNRDALDPATVNQGLAEMNATANAADSAIPPAAASAAAKPTGTQAIEPTPAKQASATEQTENGAKPEEHEVSAKTTVPSAPTLSNSDGAPPSNQPVEIQPLNNSAEGNSAVENDPGNRVNEG